MTATNAKIGEISTFVIKVGGNVIPDGLNVLSVYIEKQVNCISSAQITILDGDAGTGTFDVSSSNTFVPGAEVIIEGGYDSKNELLFKGIITGQSIRIDEQVGSTLEITCNDVAIKMTVGRKSVSFFNKKDSDIISSILATYPDLTANVTATSTILPKQVQYYVSDWDFILALAEANGMLVTAENGTVSVIKPDADTNPVLNVGYGVNLLGFDANLNAITQYGNVKADSWDYQTQAVRSATATNDVNGPGNISSKTLSEVVGLSDFQLQTPAALSSDDLTNWSKAQLIKSEYSKIRGTAKLQGTSLANLAKYITLEGLGDRFNGNHFLSAVKHEFSSGNWITELSVGFSPLWFTQKPDVMAPPASGLLPGVRGLFTGTVKQIYNDPDSQYRILVNVPLFDTNGDGIWARLSNFYSTGGAGAFFLPEAGDEVVLGFLNEDPRYPIILGSMYSNTNHKPYSALEPNEKNSLKAIVSKSGISVQFDDENKVLTVTTPNKNTVTLSDQNKQITIKDENANSIIMSSEGITIKSSRNINIEADQNLILKGTTGIQVQSSGGDVQTEGKNIKEKADMQYVAEGGMTAQVQAGTELTLKGAMVMIN